MGPLIDIIFSLGEAVPYISKAVKAGVSVEDLLGTLAENGINAPVDAVQKAYDYITGVGNQALEYITNLGINDIPNILNLPLSLTKQIRNFAYTVQFAAKDAFGNDTSQYIVISSNQIMTKQQAQDLATEMVLNNNENYDLSYLGPAETTNIQINSGGLVAE